jgi:hypothetical protein
MANNLLQVNGASPQKQPRWVPIFMDKAFTGLYTQRNVLHDPSDFVTGRFYGGRPDALIDGLNVELTNRLTLQRRPGLSAFSTALYPTPISTLFSFEQTDGTIQVIVDTASSGDLAISSVAASIATTAVYTGTFPGGGSNGYAGLTFIVTGFTNNQNNGTFTCSASTTTTLTLSNSAAIAETHAATALTAGGVYIDNQNGTKTFIYAKPVGALESSFVSVGGFLYIGNGVTTVIYNPSTGLIYNLGIVAPVDPPSVDVTASDASAPNWTASTFWSTMGLIYDAASGTILQLNSVNASGVNTTRFGTSGPGQPTAGWNQTEGDSTTDNGVTWDNYGPIVLWTPNTPYGSQTHFPNSLPVIIYDPKTEACYEQIRAPYGSGRAGSPRQNLSGAAYPSFIPGSGQVTIDNQCTWQYLAPGANAALNSANGIPAIWKASFGYIFGDSVSEPVSLVYGLPSNQTVYWQAVSVGGTSSTGTSPFSSAIPTGDTFVPAGYNVYDNGDLIWLSLGSYTWAASTVYTQWAASGSAFSALVDSNGNFQVCITGGTSATVAPQTSFTLSAAANASSGTTSYTGTFSPTIPVGSVVVISGFVTHTANNGTFTVVSCNSTTLVVNNSNGVAETHAAAALYNSWGVGYGTTTTDGTVVWTCVGTASQWAGSIKWYLPVNGFAPPSSTSPFGGAGIDDSNGNLEFIINSGLGGASAPTWAAIGKNTADGGTPLTLTQVSVSGTTTTYTGTITGGGSNAFAGQVFLIAGFVNTGNDVLIKVTASSTTTLVCTTTTQVNETHAGTATTGAIWFNEEAFPTQSLIWQFGYSYAYSYQSRSLTDYYSTPINGVLPIPPGLSSPLPAPTGSETGAISSASPATTITGASPPGGAVNLIDGVGSTDPAVDTIIIWRSADGGGPDNMFELTVIPNPPPIGGIAQPWLFRDYLPDTATTIDGVAYPGLDDLIPAPINGVNNPPPAGFFPQVYNFGRIFGFAGNTVYFSGGPDTLAGNPNTAFNIEDSFPFLADVIRIVQTSQGLVVFLTDGIWLIGGGPATDTFFDVILAPGVGILNYFALDVYAGEIYFLSSDSQFKVLSPSLNLTNTGFPIGDKLVNFDASIAQVAVLQSGLDACIFISDGATGWYRLNPRQVPGGINGPEPIFSPFAVVTGGLVSMQTIEISPGIKKLLVGTDAVPSQILERNLSVFTDNGTAYDAYVTMGSIVFCHPGQIAALKFIEMDMSGVAYKPTVSYLLNEISGTFTPFVQNPVADPPVLYGQTGTAKSYSPNRWYFMGNASLALARHMQIKIDFGTTSNGDELYNLTIFGRLFVEL